MQVLGSRKGGIVTLVVAGVAIVAAAAFAIVQLLQRPSVNAPSPAPDSAVAQPRPDISFSVDDGQGLGDLKVMLDGQDVTEARPRRRRRPQRHARRPSSPTAATRWR